jgi:hypothetical protein
VIDELLLRDHLTRVVGKIDQDIQRPIAEGKHLTVAPKDPLADQKLKRAKLQVSVTTIASHGSQPDFPHSAMHNPHEHSLIDWAYAHTTVLPQPVNLRKLA